MAAPATPANLAITYAWSNVVILNWDDSAGATGYYLYRSLDDVTYDKIATLTSSNHNDFRVEPSTQYYYKVSAYNNDGESALSAAVNDTTQAVDEKYCYISSFGNHPFDANALNRDFAIVTGKALYAEGDIRVVDIACEDISCDTVYPDEDVVLQPTRAIYFGLTNVDGSWRIIRSGNDLVIQRRESSSWVTKSTISA